MRTADGRTLWATFSVRPAPEAEDASRGLAMVMDITDRKRAEQRLEFYAEELERSNQELQQFAHVVSHDLREPIRMIKSYLDLLEDRYRPELDEDAEEFIQFAVEGAERMDALIDSLLSYSRVKTQAEPAEPVDLGEVLDRVRKDLALPLEETDAQIEADDLPTVKADPTQLRQLMQNLVGNAIKYAGEVPRVRVEAEPVEDWWRIHVADDGPGIPEEDQGSVFEVFHRGVTAADQEGTGIGLAICKRIVERHGGRIRVSDSDLGGARFSFELPSEAIEAPVEELGVQAEARAAPS